MTHTQQHSIPELAAHANKLTDAGNAILFSRRRFVNCKNGGFHEDCIAAISDLIVSIGEYQFISFAGTSREHPIIDDDALIKARDSIVQHDLKAYVAAMHRASYHAENDGIDYIGDAAAEFGRAANIASDGKKHSGFIARAIRDSSPAYIGYDGQVVSDHNHLRQKPERIYLEDNENLPSGFSYCNFSADGVALVRKLTITYTARQAAVKRAKKLGARWCCSKCGDIFMQLHRPFCHRSACPLDDEVLPMNELDGDEKGQDNE